jgi:hypothetical protein
MDARKMVRLLSGGEEEKRKLRRKENKIKNI